MLMLEAAVHEVRSRGGEYFILSVDSPRQAAECRPGPFFMLGFPRAHLSADPLLSRPISVYDVEPGPDGKPARVVFLVKKVGRGTELLSLSRPGDVIPCHGPLGNTFPAPAEDGPGITLVGGGVGIAPVYFYASYWRHRGTFPLFYGGRRSADLPVQADIRALASAQLVVATEDGSEGFRGLVTEAMAGHVAEHPAENYFCCGPVPMMRAVVRAVGDPARVWASMENRMACGLGACLGCAIPVRDQAADDAPLSMKRVCKEGPVFPAGLLPWDALSH